MYDNPLTAITNVMVSCLASMFLFFANLLTMLNKFKIACSIKKLNKAWLTLIGDSSLKQLGQEASDGGTVRIARR